MSKKHKLLTILLCLALSFMLVFSLVACDTIKDEPTDVVDSSKIIANGNFELTSSTDFPKSPSSWKGAPGSSSGDNATETDIKNLVSGVISVDKATYDKNKRTWDKVANPLKTSTVENDNNVLMIYNKKLNAYRYTSNDFTLESNKYFKITVDVKTDKIEGSGAYVGIGGDAYEYLNIGNTNGFWVTVSFYIQSSNLNSNNINVVLGNGTKGKNDGSLSKGYTFFDNILASEVEYADYNAITEDATNRVYKTDLRVSDGEFENISLTGSNIYSPNLWSGVSTSAPTGTDSLEKGIVNFNESRPEFMPAGITPVGADNKALVINNKKRTAYGYRSSKRLRIETSKYYKLTVNIATFIDDLATGSTPNAGDAGAYVRLKSGTGAEDMVQGASITGINTSGEFKEVSIYIKGDTMRNKDFYIELGLGLGEKDDPLLVTGIALFDSLTLSEINSDGYSAAPSDSLNTSVSIDTGSIENSIPEANSDPTTFFERDKVAYLDTNITYKGQDIVAKSTTAWDEAWGVNPLSPNDSITSVIELKNTQPTANIYKFSSSKYQSINSNGYYRLGMWVKTQDILKAKGISLALYAYDQKKASEQPNLEEKDLVTKLSSIDNINTLNIKNHITASYNDYVELAFYIEGDLLKDKQIYLQVSMGSGTFLESSKHVKGSAYIADITFYPIAYGDYNAAEAGTYLKKYSFKTTNASIQNGDFDDINKQSTLNVYSKNNKDFALNYKDGYLDNAFGVPSNWTQSDEAYLRSSLNAGIMSVNSSTLKAEINKNLDADKKIGFGDEFYNGFDSEFGSSVKSSTNPNVLVINTKKANAEYVLTESTRPEVCGCTSKKCTDQKFCDGTGCDAESNCAHKNYSGLVKPWGYTSPSISLSADKYYMISVWAYVVEGKATISLKSSSKDQTKKFSLEATNGWQRFDFFVETGFDSTSANLELFLGDTDNNDELYNGTVFFDMPRYTTISQDEYDKASKDLANELLDVNYNMTSYTVMTFDNITSNTDNLDTPVGWEGAHRDTDAPAEDKDIVSGVYDIDHGNRTLFGKDDATRIPEDILNSIYTDTNNKALVINNNTATEYAYTYKLPKSLTKESYYMFSVDVLTYGLSKDTVATITLKLEGTSYSFAKNLENGVLVNSEFDKDGNATGRSWRTYYFYLNTPKTLSIDNTTIILGLGNKDKENYAQGYAFFDNINIKKIDADAFPEETQPETVVDGDENAHKYNKAITHRIVFTDADVEKEEPTTQEKTNPYLWLQISSGIIGGLIVIVLIYYVGKKLYAKFGKKNKGARAGKSAKGKQAYNRNRVPSSKTTDDNKKSNDKYKD